MTRPSQRPASSWTMGVGVGPAVGGQDQHRAAELGGHRLVAEHDLGVVGAGQVGEDDAVGGVPALGELAPQAAGVNSRLGGRRSDPRRVVRRTLPESRRARETVAIETPARCATSRIVVAHTSRVVLLPFRLVM